MSPWVRKTGRTNVLLEDNRAENTINCIQSQCGHIWSLARHTLLCSFSSLDVNWRCCNSSTWINAIRDRLAHVEPKAMFTTQEYILTKNRYNKILMLPYRDTIKKKSASINPTAIPAFNLQPLGTQNVVAAQSNKLLKHQVLSQCVMPSVPPSVCASSLYSWDPSIPCRTL